jgi:hypothetical protein
MLKVEARDRTCVTLLVPGERKSLQDWARGLGRTELRLEEGELLGSGLPGSVAAQWIANNGGFGPAFGYGTVTRAEQQAIAEAPGALLLELQVELDLVRRQVAALASALGELGALGVRLEESKLGYSVERWVALVGGDDPWSLYRATVVVLNEGGLSRTCGMHAFSWPDAQVAVERGDEAAANRLLGDFNVFQLVDRPVLRSGETFSLNAQEARRRLERWPDDGYPSGHACNNPFGVWRLGAPGSRSSRLPELVPTIMPPLVSILLGRERAVGRALTRHEVERITTESPAVALAPDVAQKVERSRGYADLEPELAWEQWCLVRSALTTDPP